ncbi:hypothetical protein ACTMTJ_44870 [Phytohabitans sp. LJ34]|uniref:hypothetical protein n=1 Tax=Phytohabitans sp. LJ34 TaxID=3452217 RepID=UPI003F8BF123
MSIVRVSIAVAALAAAAVALAPSSIGLGEQDEATKQVSLKDENVVRLPPASASDYRNHKVTTSVDTSNLDAQLAVAADRYMAGDAALSAMLQGVAYKVVKEGPWTRQKTDQRIGIVRELRLERPVDTPMREWPVARWDEAADTYKEGTFKAAYRGVSSITVHIADAAGVVSLIPGNSVVVSNEGSGWRENSGGK